ncbi:unnamed protein product [Ectocarpus sp. CCAP 1310/34]|nr:unnamed protein product [Ectocarpus sp. CCAP 1310/34]
MEPGQKPDDYINQKHLLRHKVQQMGEKISDSYFKDIEECVTGFTDESKDVKMTVYRDPNFNVNQMQTTMRHMFLDEQSRKWSKGGIAGRDFAMVTTTSEQTSHFGCGEKRHIRRNCPQRRGQRQRKTKPRVVDNVTLNGWEGFQNEKVERATKGLKNWEAPGHDSIPTELLKIDDDNPFFLGHLHNILVKVWNGGDTPLEWEDATIKVLYKKGDRFNYYNYRGIPLLSHVGKVPIKIITNRLSAFCKANNILLDEQCGFRPGRSTVDMLFVVRRLQELGRRSIVLHVLRRLDEGK